MLSRRLFIGCAPCAVTESSATAVSAQAPPTTGLKRNIGIRSDGPSAVFATIVVEVEVDAGFFVARHTPPGIESPHVTQGGGVLMVDGQPDRALKAGTGRQNRPARSTAPSRQVRKAACCLRRSTSPDVVLRRRRSAQ